MSSHYICFYKEVVKSTRAPSEDYEMLGCALIWVCTVIRNYGNINTLQPLYNTVRYNTVLDITRFKNGSQKCIDYIEK